ncbi:serine/threonine protein kinase [Stappia sp. BW2]|uniref:serine/threonine protein kinase n=1 Tax=Stappia sp. BW2 TaxID=2592622 RepID=UPI0011DE7866|nr:serine/threonine protein kinase [Stappia sp. BW2]TYC79974.1 serine/threonine protein kinase [Stappia sp. BW2]
MRLFLLAAGLLLMSAVPSVAQRVYCPLPEDGVWVYPDAKPKEISRIEVDSRCENEAVHVRVRAFTSCIPRDCKWGWTKAEMRSDGAIQVLLIGFLSSKQLTLRAFGDLLDVHVINVVNDLSEPRTENTYNLQRK